MSVVKVSGNASGTGIFTVAAPATNTDRTLTLPDATGTLVNADASGNIAVTGALRSVASTAQVQLVGGTNTAGSTSLDVIQASDSVGYIYNRANGPLIFGANNTGVGRFDTNGNFQFNSGYGSLAVAYGCRAWVNFNGTGTVAIRASGNVSSITDNGVGYYTVNFTNAMPDANYAAIASSTRTNNNTAASTDMNCVNVIVGLATSSYIVKTGYPSGINTNEDSPDVRTAVFR